MSLAAQRIVLTGFMGAGKTAVGRALAEHLAWDFVDTDAVVEGMAGQTIPELFAGGEDVFRRWEAQAIAAQVPRTRVVVATGGGALTQPAARQTMAILGPVACLDAPAEVLWSRAGAEPGRPLATDEAAFHQRLAERAALYAAVPYHLATMSNGPVELARRLATDLITPATTVPVALGERSYLIDVAPGALSRLAERLPGNPGLAVLVVDGGLPTWHREVVETALALAGWQPHVVVIPAGEPSKSMEMATRLYDACAGIRLRRHQPVIALGGGVVGDLAGFVAATYMRGVPFVQIPTTLLAQIDSSVGGKVAVNHPRGKNLIGAFYQPQAVVADPLCLLTLSDREYRAGLAEMVKYGVIMDRPLFEQMKAMADALALRDVPVLTALVARCCQLKAQVVAADEREAPGGPRTTLNFGHTVGHAIEAVAGYGTVLHGEAVAIGMRAAGQLAVDRGMFGPADQARVVDLLHALGLETAMPADLDRDALLESMSHDKKNRDAGVTFVLPRALGEVVVAGITTAEIRRVIG